MPVNVYEQNICGRIPPRQEREGRWKVSVKNNPSNNIQKRYFERSLSTAPVHIFYL